MTLVEPAGVRTGQPARQPGFGKAQASRSIASIAVPALRQPVVPELLTTSILSTLYPSDVRGASWSGNW
ncbi:hypothetical protein [Streptomyces barringtoniae]|uniref:hypothetical protein n=1 Tax=Streptomyces barringtoniae TaxID=2892029 RepID=UPI001E2BE44F|nr:hypothetical protein [Streptomyces barringtoniae]MCC5473703.1 hypothetical protein [Streptomyces barringtoniae]